jgi:hypothetical protein
MPDPHLRMAEMTLSQPITGAPPDAVAGIATQFILEDLVKGRITFLVAFTFTGTRGRLWQLHDVIPADEVVRAIAEREEAEAVVVVHPMPVPPEVDGERCFNIAAEAEAGKFDNLVAFKQGAEGEMFRIYGRRHTGDVHFRWLGVPPEGEVDVWFEGIVGAIGSTKGET